MDDMVGDRDCGRNLGVGMLKIYTVKIYEILKE